MKQRLHLDPLTCSPAVHIGGVRGPMRRARSISDGDCNSPAVAVGKASSLYKEPHLPLEQMSNKDKHFSQMHFDSISVASFQAIEGKALG